MGFVGGCHSCVWSVYVPFLGFSTTYLGAQGYSSIECEGTEARLDECDIDEVDTSHYCSYVGVVKCYDG